MYLGTEFLPYLAVDTREADLGEETTRESAVAWRSPDQHPLVHGLFLQAEVAGIAGEAGHATEDPLEMCEWLTNGDAVRVDAHLADGVLMSACAFLDDRNGAADLTERFEVADEQDGVG